MTMGLLSPTMGIFQNTMPFFFTYQNDNEKLDNLQSRSRTGKHMWKQLGRIQWHLLPLYGSPQGIPQPSSLLLPLSPKVACVSLFLKGGLVLFLILCGLIHILHIGNKVINAYSSNPFYLCLVS